ncbi:MAG: CBS domain-containing protein [Planctomycetota bacterium]
MAEPTQRTAREVMSSPLYTIRTRDTVQFAAQMMRDQQIGSLLVTDPVHYAGMITDRDITVRVVAEGRDPNATIVREVMTEGPIACGPDDSLEDVAALMARHRIRRVAVVDGTQMVGIVALEDLAGYEVEDLTRRVLASIHG